MAEDITRYLGELVVAFSQLEDALCEGLAEVLDLSYDDAKVVFSPIAFKRKVQILNALLRKYEGNYCNGTYIYELLSKANALEDRRNTLIHSDWEYFCSPESERAKRTHILKRSKVKYNRKDRARVSVEEMGSTALSEMESLTAEIGTCADDLCEGFGQIGCDLGSCRRQ